MTSDFSIRSICGGMAGNLYYLLAGLYSCSNSVYHSVVIFLTQLCLRNQSDLSYYEETSSRCKS